MNTIKTFPNESEAKIEANLHGADVFTMINGRTGLTLYTISLRNHWLCENDKGRKSFEKEGRLVWRRQDRD